MRWNGESLNGVDYAVRNGGLGVHYQLGVLPLPNSLNGMSSLSGHDMGRACVLGLNELQPLFRESPRDTPSTRRVKVGLMEEENLIRVRRRSVDLHIE